MTAAQVLSYGNGTKRVPADAHELDPEQKRLMSWLEAFLAAPLLDLPRPPSVVLEIIEASRKPMAKREELAVLLERNPLLSGRVLRLANSAMYASASPCVTLEQALSRMGLALVRDVVMEAAMQLTVIHADGFNATLESIRRHSSAVAWISRFVARNTPIEAENAFMVGLLHDVGLSVSLTGISEYLRRGHQPVRLTPDAWRVAETMHERFSEVVLESWGLPPSLTLVAKHHHALMRGAVPHPQVAVLIVAEQIAADAGWAIEPEIESPTADCRLEHAGMEETDRALQALSLTRRHFVAISADLKRVLETLEGQFRHTRAHAPRARDAESAR